MQKGDLGSDEKEMDMKNEGPKKGLEWSNLTLGSWAVVAPFLLGFGSAPAAMWTHVLIGLCVASIAIVQLMASRRTQEPSRTRPTAAE